MKILVLIEHDNKSFKQVNYHIITAAMQLGQEIDVLIIGKNTDAVIQQVQKLPGIHNIINVDANEYEHQLAENTSALIADIATQYQYVLAPATTYGKNLLPRAAALKDVAMIADVVKIISADTFVRPIYAGNALATVQSMDAIKFLTIRATAFSAVTPQEAQQVPVDKVMKIIENTTSQFVSQELSVSSRPELTSARIVVSGGRGLKSADNFKQVEALADHLGAAVGASRAAVDAGFAPNDYQVGQTGKIVAPDLYIAIGISGAIQHLAGMKDSKVIVAINSDPDAPIFEVADYGLVSDLFTAIQQLQAQL